MKQRLPFILLMASLWSFAQPDTEVFVMDISVSDAEIAISNFRNASNNPGYDNQPSFYDNNNLVFAKTRDGATDIGAMNLPSNQGWWISIPTEGGEYSPVRMPESGNLAAVRLDPDGLQRLYEYPVPEGPSKLLIDDLQVAYYAFYDKEQLLASVLSDNRLDLVLHNFTTKQTDTLLEKSGRSIHKVPGRDSMSYTAVNDEGNHDIYLLDMKDRESYFICQLPIGIQDYAWLNEDQIVIGSNDKLFVYDTADNGKWTQMADLSTYKVNEITRLAVGPASKQLAIACESSALSPSATVNAHVKAYAAKDLDAFVSYLADDFVFYDFPDRTLLSGLDQIRQVYTTIFNGPEFSFEVADEITIGNFVIQNLKVNANGVEYNQGAIYEVNNGTIISAYRIEDVITEEDPTVIVQQQLDAYNNRDIDAFVATYTDDVVLYNFPKTLRSEGAEQMHTGYKDFFDSTPDLHCEIKNRIRIGNKVIDEEYLTMNGQNFTAVAVYEVTDGKISKVTFMR